MTQRTNSYDKLYENMKQRFTVSINENEYTLGEYMLMKADGRRSEDALPVSVNNTAVAKTETAVANIVSFVNDKLTVKQTPVKDRTIKKFPFRATASAFLTAAVACAFVLTFALIGAKSLDTSVSVANDVSIMEQIPEDAVNARH